MERAVAEAVAILGRTPDVLRALLKDVPAPWLERTEGEGTFAPRDVIGHLIHGERTDWVPRLRHILEFGDARPFVPFDRRGYGPTEGVAVAALLDEFDVLRRSSLADLEGLSLRAEQLALTGLHPELGRVTLGQLLSTWVVHDLNHIGQAVRVMSKRYAEAVGPWKVYLGILNR
jgi:hypothetical protein